jgi:hypothetical protein
VHLATAPDDADAAAAEAAEAAERVEAYLAEQDEPEPGSAAGGYVVPFTLHEGLGDGWLYVDKVIPDALGRMALPLLGAHAANAVYSAAFRTDAPLDRPVIMESGRQ